MKTIEEIKNSICKVCHKPHFQVNEYGISTMDCDCGKHTNLEVVACTECGEYFGVLDTDDDIICDECENNGD